MEVLGGFTFIIHSLYKKLTWARLDLTTASRVHLLEPQWNPAVEEQALARVYRMGQRRPVVTIRYIMKDSIEEVCRPYNT